MTIIRFFTIMETVSSEVSERNFFTTWSTIYIPDFFVIFFYLTTFCFAVISDVFILFYISLNENNSIFGVVFLITTVLRIIFEFFVERKSSNEFFSSFNEKFRLILNLMGLRSILLSARVLKETSDPEKSVMKPLSCITFPIFHISNENLSLVKIYCFVAVIFKSIPQLFIMCVLLLDSHVAWTTGLLATTNILFNMVIFSFTISITFPIRKTPRIFTNSASLFFSAFNKFMATWCACCINLAIFAVLFKSIGYYALTIYLFKCTIWAWPCWQVLKSQAVLSGLYLVIYLIFITFVFGFIYIHPLEGQGILYYYFFYFVTALFDLVIIYAITDGHKEYMTSYLTLRIIMLGFLCNFGLFNSLHIFKVKKNECLCHLRMKPTEDENNKEKDNKINLKEESVEQKTHEKELSKVHEIKIVEKMQIKGEVENKKK